MKNIFITIVGVLMLSSCINEKGFEVTDTNNRSEVRVNIYLDATQIYTRTEEGWGLDSKIGIDNEDYAIFLIDSQNRIIQQVQTELSVKESDSQTYVLTGKFNPEDLTEFSLMALANWKGDFKGSYFNKDLHIGLTTLEDLYRNEDSFIFHYPAIYQQDDKWTPDINDEFIASLKKYTWLPGENGIPMFGISEKRAINSEMPEEANMTINMLRSLAKIEIINETPEEENVVIKGCYLSNYLNEGRFIPDGTLNENWATTAQPFEKPSLPSNFVEAKGLFFRQPGDDDTFVTYLPEMDFSEMSGNPFMVLQLEVDYTLYTYRIELGDYKEGEKVSDWQNIIRNYNYKFRIISAGQDGHLTLEASPWNVYDDLEWTYEEATPVFAEGGDFELHSEKIEGEQNDIYVVSTTDYAEGSFTLEKPLNGRWILTVFTEDQTPADSFIIKIQTDEASDEWSEGSPSVSDGINGEKVKFRIYASRTNEDLPENIGRLVLTTSTSDGRIRQVDLAKDKEADYLTIKQYRNF